MDCWWLRIRITSQKHWRFRAFQLQKKRELLFQPWGPSKPQKKKRSMTEPRPSKGELNFVRNPRSVDLQLNQRPFCGKTKQITPTFFHFWCVMRCSWERPSKMGIPSPNPAKTGFGSRLTQGRHRWWTDHWLLKTLGVPPGTQPLGGSSDVTFPTTQNPSAPKKLRKTCNYNEHFGDPLLKESRGYTVTPI